MVHFNSIRLIKALKASYLAALFPSVCVCVCVCGPANGQRTNFATPAAHAATSFSQGKMIEIDQTRALIPDVTVLTNEGRNVRLYSDLIKNKVVLLSFFYTTCANVCPVQGEVLSQVQDELGRRMGHDVFMISISMNPEADTREALKHWAKAFGVRKGWTLVSSNSAEMRKMIQDFTGNAPGPRESHYSIVFIGNDNSGSWRAANGITGSAELIMVIDLVGSAASARRTRSTNSKL